MEKVHGVILCCFDMRSKITCIPSQEIEGYFGNVSRTVFQPLPFHLSFPFKTTFFASCPCYRNKRKKVKSVDHNDRLVHLNVEKIRILE